MSSMGIGSGLKRRMDRCVKIASPTGIESRLWSIGPLLPSCLNDDLSSQNIHCHQTNLRQPGEPPGLAPIVLRRESSLPRTDTYEPRPTAGGVGSIAGEENVDRAVLPYAKKVGLSYPWQPLQPRSARSSRSRSRRTFGMRSA